MGGAEVYFSDSQRDVRNRRQMRPNTVTTTTCEATRSRFLFPINLQQSTSLQRIQYISYHNDEKVGLHSFVLV